MATDPGLWVILQKLEDSSSEVALSVTPRPGTLRRDVVQSNDDDECFYVVDTMERTLSEPVIKKGVSQWKVLFPSNHSKNAFGTPIHTDPLYFLVFFYIKEYYVKQFIDLIVEEGIQVHQEESKSVRFDLWQSLHNPTEFVVLEAVQDWAGIEEHHSKNYYKKVREALWDMQAKPRSHDRGYKVLFSKGYEESAE